jgi:sialidase-1
MIKGNWGVLLAPMAILVTISLYGQKPPLETSNYHNLAGGLGNSHIQFDRNQQGRIAFLGGSITYNGGWRDSLMAYFEKRFPNTDFEFVAAGIPSMGSTPSSFRLHRDVISKGRIDLLFLEAAVNDATNGRSSREQIRGMEGVVRNLRRSNEAADVVIMHFVDPVKMNDYRQGREPKVITYHNKVAQHYGIPTINLAKEITDRIEHQEFTWEDDFKDLHPSPFGQGVYAHSMIEFLEHAYDGKPDQSARVSPHPLPDKLDPWCYDNGRLIDISTIEPAAHWALIPNWEPKDDTGTRSNYTAVPMLISHTPGAIISMDFQGSAVGIAVAAGQDAGTIEFRIDQGPWQEQNLYTRWSSQLHLPWYYTLASELPGKMHQLEIRISQEKDPQSNGHACRIRYFFVNAR